MNMRPPQRGEQREVLRPAPVSGIESRFIIDPATVPDGMVYQWKRKTILGMEDTEHQIMLAERGWTPVPASRHRDKAGRVVPDDAPIVRGGLVLMEQPKEFTRESRAQDLEAARDQVRTQFARLGQSDRGALPRERPKVRRSYAPPPAGSE